jgi:hypothetical protein
MRASIKIVEILYVFYDRSSLLKTSKRRIDVDGLSSLNGSYVARIEPYKLYTKIYVDINQKYIAAVISQTPLHRTFIQHSLHSRW